MNDSHVLGGGETAAHVILLILRVGFAFKWIARSVNVPLLECGAAVVLEAGVGEQNGPGNFGEAQFGVLHGFEFVEIGILQDRRSEDRNGEQPESVFDLAETLLMRPLVLCDQAQGEGGDGPERGCPR